MADVPRRDHDTLVAGQTLELAHFEEAFDLLVDPSYRLDLASLIDRAGNGDVLSQGQLRQRREERIELGAGGAVPFDSGVGLLEADARIQGQRLVLAEASADEAAHDQDPLVVDIPAHLALPLDVHHPAAPHGGDTGDPVGPAEPVVPDIEDRKSVDLPGLGILGVDEDHVLLDHPLDLVLDHPGTAAAGVEGGLHVFDLDLLGLPALLFGPVSRLGDQVGHREEPGGEAFLVSGQPGPLFGDAGHRLLGKGEKIVLLAPASDELGVLPQVLIG